MPRENIVMYPQSSARHVLSVRLVLVCYRVFALKTTCHLVLPLCALLHRCSIVCFFNTEVLEACSAGDIQTAGNGILTVPGYDCGGGL